MSGEDKEPPVDKDAASLKRKAESPAEGEGDGERRAAAPAAGFSGFSSAAKSGFAAFASGSTSSAFGEAAASGGFGTASGGFGTAGGGLGSLSAGGFGSTGSGFGSGGGGFGNSLFPSFGASGSTGKPLFGSTIGAGGATDGADEDENGGGNSPPPLEPNYTPVVTLAEQEKVTGEEDEVPVCSVAGTLYAFESPDGVRPSAWKERGRGDLHVNLAQAGSTARMVMRAKGHLRLILNAKIFPGMSVKEMDGGKGVTFACINAADQENAESLRTFALRMSGKDASEKASFLLGKLAETVERVSQGAEETGVAKEGGHAEEGKNSKGGEAPSALKGAAASKGEEAV